MRGDLLQKMIKSWSRKTAIDVKYTPQTKRERREREIVVVQLKYEQSDNLIINYVL